MRRRYCMRVHSEEQLEGVLNQILDREVDREKNTVTVWIATAMSEEELSKIPGVLSVIISHDQSGIPKE